jgi:lysophospholipase L1-like esterase
VPSSGSAFRYTLYLGILLLSGVLLFSIDNPAKVWLTQQGLYFYQLDLPLGDSSGRASQRIVTHSVSKGSDNANQTAGTSESKEPPTIPKKTVQEIYPQVKVAQLKGTEKRHFDSLRAVQEYLFLAPESESLAPFFNKLKQRQQKGIRLWYYGDSQIEGDRITSEIRKSLQAYFGGSGMGYIPLSNPASYTQLELSNQSDWIKYNCFQHRKKTDVFGPSGLLFVPKDPQPSKWNSIKLKLNKSLKYKQLYLECSSDTLYQVEWKFAKDTEWNAAHRIVRQMGMYQYAIGDSALTGAIEIRCRGSQLKVYGLSIEGEDKGIQLDNFGIRGHSGDGLKAIPNQLLTQITLQSGTGLIIFHFGNNMIPYLKTDPRSEKWAKDIFRSVFRKYKTDCPGISFIMIGPGDMGYHKSGTTTSYASCPILNQWLKDVSLEEGISYFDFYQLFQDKGGILGWRDAHLASLDGHLTPRGQKVFAEEFSKELISAFEAYQLISKK